VSRPDPRPGPPLLGRLAARQWLALPRQVATTAHLCAAYPFAVQADLGVRGVFLGQNRLTGGGFFFDLFEAYQAGLVQGPNMVVSGAGAYGKSALVKSYLYRSSVLTGPTGRPRFVAVIDPKGEWVPLAARLGWAVLALRPGGGVRVNPLDPGPAGHGSRPAQTGVADHAAAAAATMLTIALGQPELGASQRRLVGAAVRRISQNGQATLADLRRLLADPPADLAAELDTTPAELSERRRPLLDAAAMLVEHDLRGIVDGPATVEIDWDRTPGLVLDLSALLANRKALRLVLTAAAGWLTGLLYSQPDRHTLTVIDEGWAALEDLAIVRFLQDQWRLGRQWGSGNVLITHALADLRSQTDDGTAQGKIAEGLLNTTSIRVFLHQNPEQVGRLLADLGLTTTEADVLAAMGPLQALWKIGAHTALVDHQVTDAEWAFCDTDTAMTGRTQPRP
jgi:hypothetical protein